VGLPYLDSWKFKSAASWLLGKVRTQIRAEAHRARPPSPGAARQPPVAAAKDDSPNKAAAQALTLTAASSTHVPELHCNSSIARMLVDSPCATPCLETCLDAIYSAYA